MCFEEVEDENSDKNVVKDQEGNKDLNNLAIEELKRAQYFFAYMRQ